MPETPDWSAPLQAPVISLGDRTILAAEGGTIEEAVPAQLGRRIVVVQLVLAAFATSNTGQQLRDWVTLLLINGQAGDVIARVAISPDQPLASAPILYGQAATDANTPLLATASTRSGSGSQLVAYDLAYYLGD